VSLDYPQGSLRSHPDADRIRFGAATQQISMPFIDDVSVENSAADSARWTVAHSSAPLDAVRGALDRWLLAALAGAVLLAFLSARLLAARVNRPLEELAEQSTHVHLDRFDAQLATERADEIGTLSRSLDDMVRRLRAGANELRAAERRATVGDLARQVNHDVRNGLLPIRNVIRHLAEVARESPGELGAVFAEREGTLQGGINYLESLATNYARLSPRTERRVCDVNETVRTVLEQGTTDARVQLQLGSPIPRVLADPVALRRVIENLVVNALESLEGANGTVTVRTAIDGKDSERIVTLNVTDTGRGIAADALQRIFDDFYTTKERGTGLGLSIVRRLVADMGGRIYAASEPGRGTTFRIELPEAL
jgi:signal transduction histidine kinase